MMQVLEWRARVDHFAAHCAPALRSAMGQWFSQLWVNMELTADAVTEFEREVTEIERRYW